MKVYLIRHGETDFNAKKVYQTCSTTISSKGQQQALKVVSYVRNLNIEIIFSSPLKRAFQTASIIKKEIMRPIILKEELVEIRRPSVIVGKSYNDTQVIKIKELIKNNYHKLDWRYSDEENFKDLNERVKKFMSWLADQRYNNILVVSHGFFIKMFVSLIIFKEKLTPTQFLNFCERTSISNIGLTLCEHNANKWKLIYLNK